MSTNFSKIPFPTIGKAERAGVGMGPMLDLISTGDFGFLTQDYVFVGDALPGEINSTLNGTAAAVAAGTGGRGLLLTTGTDTEGHSSIATGLAYSGDLGLLAEFWIELPATITTYKFECGVTDAVADIGAVNAKASPTATATDFAVFVHDTADDTALAFHSAKAGSIVATEGLDTVSASDKFYFAIRIIGDNVQAWFSADALPRNLTQVTGHGAGAGIEGGSLLTPWVMVQARAGANSRTLTVVRMRITGALI